MASKGNDARTVTGGTEAHQSAHTPGPWTLQNGTVLGADGVGVTRPFERFDGAASANARLIAAAPELLAALQEIAIAASRQQGSGGDVFDFQDRLRECGDKARAAIAKAGGAA